MPRFGNRHIKKMAINEAIVALHHEKKDVVFSWEIWAYLKSRGYTNWRLKVFQSGNYDRAVARSITHFVDNFMKSMVESVSVDYGRRRGFRPKNGGVDLG